MTSMVTGWSTGLDGTPGTLLRECLDAAILAPSIHNSQPWRFRVTGEGVDIFADTSRQLEVIDARGRELLISVGAAVFNLRTAMLARGRMPTLRLFPAPGEPDLVARVAAGPHIRVTNTAKALARAIPRRHTNRRPFADIPVPDNALEELALAAQAEGAWLVTADDRGREALFGLVRTAEARQRRTPSYWLELAEWTVVGRGRNDGVPPEAFGPWCAAEAVPLRDFGLVQPGRRRRVEQFEPAPTIAVLSTTGDGLSDWVRAGGALERVLLTATVRGLSTTPMTQPLEIDELRELLGDSVAAHVPQAIIRMGYGPPCPPSPRRPLAEMLILH